MQVHGYTTGVVFSAGGTMPHPETRAPAEPDLRHVGATTGRSLSQHDPTSKTPSDARQSAPANTALLEQLLVALRTGRGLDGVDEALAWAALDAAGVQGGWRAAVEQAGGPRVVLARGALSSFVSPTRRTRVLAASDIAARMEGLRPWLAAGGRVVADEELRRFAQHPVCCMYGFGDGRVPAPFAHAPRGAFEPAVVAIVGSRQASPSWCERARRVAVACARAGHVVVTGGAPGIDRAAQDGARAQGGGVIVVQGTTARPPVSVAIDAGLCWLTPYGPWRAGARHLFAERNAWIAACADVVVVVCGAERSGTRHTVDAAVRLGRPVATLAAAADDPLGVIPRRVAGHGALVLNDAAVDVDTLLGAHRLSPPPAGSWEQSGDALATDPLAEGAYDHGGSDAVLCSSSSLVRLLAQGGPLLIDDAAARLCVPVRELLADVAMLELSSVVVREGALLCLRLRV
jgi:predicted Rossmann fold nucleotide-binding protein DprA/Smf involved in DNA uptake